VVKRHIREVKSMLNSKMGTEREEVQLKRRDIGRVEIVN
jgi:DNA mismatch repair ATPase MutL